MDQQFTAKQWKRAEAATIEAISDASGSARAVTEMLRIWCQTQISRSMQCDIVKVFSIKDR